MTPETIARYWAKIVRGRPDECWMWAGCAQPSGGAKVFHGRFTVDGRPVYAHRAGYELATGRSIPAGMIVRHSCDQGLCQNPKHLLLGTHAQNTDDMMRRGRHRALRGSQVTRAQLAEWQVAEIKGLLRRPIRRTAIARRFGVTLDVIGNIARGETWRHVDPVEIEFAAANGGAR